MIASRDERKLHSVKTSVRVRQSGVVSGEATAMNATPHYCRWRRPPCLAR